MIKEAYLAGQRDALEELEKVGGPKTTKAMDFLFDTKRGSVALGSTIGAPAGMGLHYYEKKRTNNGGKEPIGGELKVDSYPKAALAGAGLVSAGALLGRGGGKLFRKLLKK